MFTPKTKNSSAGALTGIWTISLTAFVIATLYFAREVLIPIALAVLLTFLLAPLVTRIERALGRVAAVLVTVSLIFVMVGGGAWILSVQMMDLANKLPDYQSNIQTKLHALRMPNSTTFTRLSRTIDVLKKELPGTEAPSDAAAAVEGGEGDPKLTPPGAPAAVPVQVVGTSNSGPADLAQNSLMWILSALGTTSLVLLLLIFMLLSREDLRSRLIRLIGKGRISATTQAMDDAGSRVSRYLLMQLIVNATYGLVIAVGLYFIGLPNAILWGVFAMVLRFIPYIGPWIASAFPIVLSLAVSSNWTMPALTVGLFIVLELLSNNVMEPWLYGSSTGISSIALIVAAVFWTWLWGPVGLVLATPLTVCMVVIGLHVPKLAFLSVLLSDQQALTPHEEFYHRLIARDPNEASDYAEAYVKNASLAALYDNVVIPALSAAEVDFREDALDEEQRGELLKDIGDIVEELDEEKRALLLKKAVAAEPDEPLADAPLVEAVAEPPAPSRRMLCVAARAERDEMAGQMLVKLLIQAGVEAQSASHRLTSGEVLGLIEETHPDFLCISVVAPSTVIQARYISGKARARFKDLRIIVGVWGATENLEDAELRLRRSGADNVVHSLSAAMELMAPAAPHTEEPSTESVEKLPPVASQAMALP